MPPRNNRRKDHLWGLTFDISVKWLLAIIVMGLIQFGTFLAQFRSLNEQAAAMTASLKETAIMAQALVLKDAIQDSDIAELKRRMIEMERRK